MANDVQVSLDSTKFDLASRRYVSELGLDGSKVVRFTAKALALDLVRLIAPRSQAQGRKAVARDINRAMWAIDPAKIRNKVLRQAVQDGEFDVVRAFLTNLRASGKGGEFANYRVESFNPSLHQMARDSRGRVRRSQGIIVLERAEHKRYVKQIQGHVGSAKSPFAVSAQHLGASIPSWLLNHSPALVEYQDNSAQQGDPNIVMANKAPGIRSIESSIIQRALNRRAAAMAKDVDQILAGRASQYFD